MRGPSSRGDDVAGAGSRSTLVATDDGLRTILDLAAHSAQCKVTVTFAKGTVYVAGSSAEDEKVSTFKITGGNGPTPGSTAR